MPACPAGKSHTCLCPSQTTCNRTHATITHYTLPCTCRAILSPKHVERPSPRHVARERQAMSTNLGRHFSHPMPQLDTSSWRTHTTMVDRQTAAVFQLAGAESVLDTAAEQLCQQNGKLASHHAEPMASASAIMCQSFFSWGGQQTHILGNRPTIRANGGDRGTPPRSLPTCPRTSCFAVCVRGARGGSWEQGEGRRRSE